MGINKFRDAAISSAQIYYSFLEENGKGLSEIQVRGIKPAGKAFLLSLRARLPASMDLDSLFFRYEGEDYSSSQIVPLEYDSEAVTLLVKPNSELFKRFSDMRPHELTVLSDLKFLVKRVEDWYSTKGDRLALPTHAHTIEECGLRFASEPSREQMNAIHDALTSPFTYIWGAPGTGKTRVVLASCVLSLVKSNHKVLLVAPTNNAVEQLLSALLPVLEANGLPIDTALRLGTPSERFARNFPTVCEVAAIERRISYIQNSLDQLEKYRSFCESRIRFKQAKCRLEALFEDYSLQRALLAAEYQAIEKNDLDSAQYRADDVLLRKDLSRLTAEHTQLDKKLHSFGITFKKAFSPGWYSELVEQQSQIERQLSDLSLALSKNTVLLQDLAELRNASNIRIKNHETALSEICAKIVEAATFWPEFKNVARRLTPKSSAKMIEKLRKFLVSGEQAISEKTTHFLKFEGLSEGELTQRVVSLTAQLKEIESSTTEARLGTVSIVAATVDKFLSMDYSLSSFSPDHIFLDEAGYCSLIKGVPLLSLDVPVTFLGDHMQLPPVCEMSDEKFENEDFRSISFWAQSAIHTESAFDSSPEEITQSYLSGQTPQFSLLKKIDLTCTYRFGEALSGILAEYIYSPLFHSANFTSTELFVLDAPSDHKGKDRVSMPEIDAIKNFLSAHPLADYAILTPYRKQLQQLSSALPTAAKDERILTVHASQGREWDTVFLSVVDTNNKWFTNSSLKRTKGKEVINTAISRAKKRLIIVCDYDYWSTQSKQLIGRIVQEAIHISESR